MFEREERYVVTKIKTGKQVECVVVEADWPEYEIVWQMIQDRVEGRQNRIADLEAKLAAHKEALRVAKEALVQWRVCCEKAEGIRTEIAVPINALSKIEELTK